MKQSTLRIVVAVIISAFIARIDAENQTCDRVLDSMIDSCKAIRNTLISTDSLDPKVACCKNVRYDMCVKGVKGYVTVAKTARVCQEAGYEEKVEALESNVAMQAVKKLCENFDTKTCITDTVSTTWQTISETLNPANLSDTISRNFHEAMNSISGFVKNIGGQTQEGASSLANRLGGLLPQQGINHYSVVPEQAKTDQTASGSDSSFSFSKLFNSITEPAVEVVQKNDDNKKKEEGGVNQFLDSVMGMFRTN